VLVVWDVLHAFAKIIFNKEEFSRNVNSIVDLARKFFSFSTERAAALKLTPVELERYLTTSLPTVPPDTRIVSTGISTTLFL
jgi:hypothetical protein